MKISKSGRWFEKIDLTELQIEKLEAIQELVTEAGERGEKAMLLAQVFPSVAALSVGFLPHEEAYRVLEIINPQGYQKAVEAGEIPAKLDNEMALKEIQRLRELVQGALDSAACGGTNRHTRLKSMRLVTAPWVSC